METAVGTDPSFLDNEVVTLSVRFFNLTARSLVRCVCFQYDNNNINNNTPH